MKPSPTFTLPEAGKVVRATPAVEIFRKDKRVKLPTRANNNAVGYDIYAFLLTELGRPSKKSIGRTETAKIPTGLIVRAPPGFYLQVCSRSGLAAKGVFIANAPGIIDPDYTGELFILLHNSGYETCWIEHDHRIAQIVLVPIIEAETKEIDVPPSIEGRGDAGFGSTGP